MLSILRFLVLLITILASCSPQWVLRPTSAGNPVQAFQDPHTPCTNCHATERPQPGDELFTPDITPSDICLNCHDYKENHHPVDFVPVDPSNFPFPLFGGKVRCLTCHEIHGGPGHEGTPKFLRGGPYADRRQSCFRCHDRERYATINPHRMLDNKGNIVELNGKPICLFCHARKPDPSVDWTKDVTFKADVGFLCWRCHPPMPGSFFDRHFLVTPSAKTLQNIRETEERRLVILPLVPRGRITCSTCHNPHQQGVIQHEAAAKGAGTASGLRMSSICYGCHRIQSDTTNDSSR